MGVWGSVQKKTENPHEIVHFQQSGCHWILTVGLGEDQDIDGSGFSEAVSTYDGDAATIDGLLCSQRAPVLDPVCIWVHLHMPVDRAVSKI